MSEIEAFLRQFHGDEPGCTSHTFAGCGSYRRLVEAIDPGAGAVLDVGCGDGYLLSLIAERHTNAPLVGVDISEAELDLARERLPQATFHSCRAQKLPLADGSIAAVVSHLALMLMDPVAPALAEIRRVLAPGGVAAIAIGSGATPSDGVWPLFGSIIREVREATGTELVRFANDLGDAGNLAAAARAAGFSGHEIASYEVDIGGSLDEVWTKLARTYTVPMFDAASRAAIESAFRERTPRASDGRVQLRLSFLELVARL